MVKTNMLCEPVVVYGTMPLLASAFGFARVTAKLDDEGFFVGFPSYWNAVVAYFYMLDSTPLVNTVIIVFLSVMVFLPTRYIYITRYPHRKLLHYVGSYTAGAALMGALFTQGIVQRALIYFSLMYPIWYTGESFYCEYKARMKAREVRLIEREKKSRRSI